MFSDALGSSGHEVLTATGVYEALRIAQRTTPDVIVTDLTLPDGDGKALVRALRAISVTAAIPVVAMAGKDAIGVDIGTKTLLADCVLHEPVVVDELLAAVAHCCAQARQAYEDRPRRWDTPAGGLSVVAADGTRWSVHQVSGHDSRTKETLMFVSSSGYLRVSEFPENWRALPTETLMALRTQSAR